MPNRSRNDIQIKTSFFPITRLSWHFSEIFPQFSISTFDFIRPEYFSYKAKKNHSTIVTWVLVAMQTLLTVLL